MEAIKLEGGVLRGKEEKYMKLKMRGEVPEGGHTVRCWLEGRSGRGKRQKTEKESCQDTWKERFRQE